MDRLLQSWVTQQAEIRPAEAAIVSGADSLTYSQLEVASNQLAHLLQNAGCQNGDRVCIVMPKSAEAIVSMVGILKAGCLHVPSTSPPRQLASATSLTPAKIASSSPAVASLPLLDELMSDESLRSRTTIIWLENLSGAADASPAPTATPEAKNFKIAFSNRDLTQLRQLRFRSIAPPATALTSCLPRARRACLRVLLSRTTMSLPSSPGRLKHYGIDHTDRFSGHTPFHFDLSTFDIFGSITAGAQLHLVPSETALLPPKLAEFIRASKLTQWFSVPSVLNYMAKFNSVQQNDFPDLRRVLWCGEVLPTPALIYWMERLPKVHFSNLYGPTEATIASSYYDVTSCPTDPKSQIPIGTPCDGEDLLVLDDKLSRHSGPRNRRPLHHRRRSEPWLLARPGQNCRRLHPGPITKTPRAACIAPAISPTVTSKVSSVSSAAPTPKSKSADTALSLAKSKRRSTRCANCRNAPSWPSLPTTLAAI